MNYIEYYGYRYERFRATRTRDKYPRFADYALLRLDGDRADVKRALWLYLGFTFFCIAGLLLFLVYLVEPFSDLWARAEYRSRVLEQAPDLVRPSFMAALADEIGRSFRFGGLIAFALPTLLVIAALWLVIGPYPRPVRFDRSTGLVYTRRFGRIWVTDWEHAKLALWRARYHALKGQIHGRHIAIRMLRPSMFASGFAEVRWLAIGWTDVGIPPDEEIGGDPSLALWHWLDDFMKGKPVETPKTGRYLLSEKLRFLPPWFPSSIDRGAQQVHDRMVAEKLYTDPSQDFTKDKVDYLPADPFFTRMGDYTAQSLAYRRWKDWPKGSSGPS